MPSGHPGVSLYQHTNGGTWYAAYRDGTRKQCRRSLETLDFQEATRIASELSVLLKSRPGDPPDGLHPRTYRLYGTRSLADEAGDAKENLEMEAMSAPPLPAGLREMNWDGTPVDRRRYPELLGKVPELVRERDSWRDRALTAEGQLHRMGKRIVKDAGLLGLPLAEAVDKWIEGFKGRDSEYQKDVRTILKDFARQFPKATLGDMQDREREIETWIYAKQIKARRRVEVRRAVIRFLEDSGVQVARKAIRRRSQREVRRDRGPIRWLTKAQASAVAKALGAATMRQDRPPRPLREGQGDPRQADERTDARGPRGTGGDMADPLRTRIMYPRVARRPLLAYLSVDLSPSGRQVRLVLTAPNGELRRHLAAQFDRVERGVGRG